MTDKSDVGEGGLLELGSASSFKKALLSFLEVDDRPDSVKVVDLDVEVLEVESMLPDINTDDGDEIEERVLVGSSGDLKALGVHVVSEPAPSGTLNTSGSRVEFLLEVIDATKVAVDSIFKGTVFEGTTVSLALGRGGGEVLPEEGMVNVTTAVELESSLESDALLGSCGFGVCGFGCVQGVDVSLMVLLVVKLHDLARDEGLESIVAVGEVWESVGHG